MIVPNRLVSKLKFFQILKMHSSKRAIINIKNGAGQLFWNTQYGC